MTLTIAALAAAQSRTPVVVELFTSEGCSSCPPADALLARLPRVLPDIEVIPLAEHVDYWNQLGWRDRFSSPLYSARQQDYGRAFELQDVFTPQMVVNGEVQFVGSDRARAEQEIRKAALEPKAAVGISMQDGPAARLRVEHLPAGTRTADVFLAITEDRLETDVGGGENGGRRLWHSGVVRSLTTIGHLDGRKAGVYSADVKINLNPEWRVENTRLVLFVQDRATRKIIGAAIARP